MLVVALCVQLASGLVHPEVGWLTLIALLDAWAGARLYHAMSDRNFADVVLVLLFLSGVALVWNSFSVS